MKRLGLLVVLLFSFSSFASGLDGYIRAREYALRFTNVISNVGLTYTIGREDDTAKRLTVTSGSRTAIANGKTVTLDRGAKVDLRGLLIPPNALRYLGCTVWAVQNKGQPEVRTTCDGKSYDLQFFAK